jgi:hypothetical protein
MTIAQIQKQVAPVKKLSRNGFYRYFERLQIKPIGCRQRPQNFPDDAADRIIIHLKTGRIVSMKELLQEKSRARRQRNGRNGHGRRAA